MEKYRKFDDARNGVNPFVPAKVAKSSPMSTIAKTVSIDVTKSHSHQAFVVDLFLWIAPPEDSVCPTHIVVALGEPPLQVFARRACPDPLQ